MEAGRILKQRNVYHIRKTVDTLVKLVLPCMTASLKLNFPISVPVTADMKYRVRVSTFVNTALKMTTIL